MTTTALTIPASDGGGWPGVLTGLKTFAALGCHEARDKAAVTAPVMAARRVVARAQIAAVLAHADAPRSRGLGGSA